MPLGAPHLLSRVEVPSPPNPPKSRSSAAPELHLSPQRMSGSRACRTLEPLRPELQLSMEHRRRGSSRDRLSQLTFDMRPGRTQYDTLRYLHGDRQDIPRRHVSRHVPGAVRRQRLHRGLHAGRHPVSDGLPPFTYSNYPVYVLLNAAPLSDAYSAGPGGSGHGSVRLPRIRHRHPTWPESTPCGHVRTQLWELPGLSCAIWASTSSKTVAVRTTGSIADEPYISADTSGPTRFARHPTGCDCAI